MIDKRGFCKLALYIAVAFALITFLLALFQFRQGVVLTSLAVFGVSTLFTAIGELRGWDK